MAKAYEAAKLAGFEESITKIIKAMDLNENDLLSLTREDINSEFSHLGWFERKKLWTFFDGLKNTIKKESRAHTGSILNQHGNVPIVA